MADRIKNDEHVSQALLFNDFKNVERLMENFGQSKTCTEGGLFRQRKDELMRQCFQRGIGRTNSLTVRRQQGTGLHQRPVFLELSTVRDSDPLGGVPGL